MAIPIFTSTAVIHCQGSEPCCVRNPSGNAENTEATPEKNAKQIAAITPNRLNCVEQACPAIYARSVSFVVRGKDIFHQTTYP